MQLPSRVALIETGPGEGFPREKIRMPTQVKVEVLERLAAAGLADILATAFGAGDEPVAQVEDAETVLERLGAPEQREGGLWRARVASAAGARRALDAGAGGLAVPVSATEGAAERLWKRPAAELDGAAREVLRVAAERGVPVSVTLAVAFGCPVEGAVAEGRVLELADGWLAAGAARVTLDDTAGLAHPRQVRRVSRALGERPVALRLADTRALGLANALAALEGGAGHFETAVAGVGGSPVEPGAPGPLATEDLAYLCEELDIPTGIDWKLLRKAGRRVLETMHRPLPARTLFIEPRKDLYGRVGRN